MIKSEQLRADGDGQVVGISHHDGKIGAVNFGSTGEVRLLLIGSDGEETEVLLLGVEYLALNNLREGNIIDRMYFWPLKSVPAFIRRRMLKSLAIDSEGFLEKKLGEIAHVFHLECSYGAEIFAILRDAKSKTLKKE